MSSNSDLPLNNRNNILIIGSGGREHAFGWKLSQSKYVKEIFYSPGNGGTSKNLSISSTNFQELRSFAQEKDCVVIIGPEAPLTKGIVDDFSSHNIRIFGPTKKASLLESSKAFAKKFMKENNIKTSSFSIFSNHKEATEYIKSKEQPLVIKADGLAAGKGVIVCHDEHDALSAIDDIMIKKIFGSAGDTVVIEDRIYGTEVSFIGFCDGNTVIPVATSQDHKRIFDNDNGPNTGGMGSFSPSPMITDELHHKIMNNIMIPTLKNMKKQNKEFKGFLYAGLMIEKDSTDPYVLEFNVRMGDPECQPIILRLQSDLYPYIDAAISGKLSSLPPLQWSPKKAVCVVMAANGYPNNYKKGDVIYGLDSKFDNNTVVFHAGTRLNQNNQIVTNGGRVLGVTSLGKDFSEAVQNVYSSVRYISWGNNDQHFRKDIGSKARLK
ncbi:MAG: phosphoribosylamine--glycine ligase [Nitrososphaeraceae archaeon]